MRRFIEQRCASCHKDIGIDGVFVTPTLSFCRVCAGLVSTLLNLELER